MGAGWKGTSVGAALALGVLGGLSGGRVAASVPSSRVASAPLTARAAGTASQRILAAAMSQTGRNLLYVMDGGSTTGATGGGFDCTGLALFAIYRATGANGFSVHESSGWVHGWGFSQWVASLPGVGTVPAWGVSAQLPYPVNAAGSYPKLRRGDILVFARGEHVGVYAGGGRFVQADTAIGSPGEAWYFRNGVGVYPLWYEAGKGQHLPATPGDVPLTAVYRFSAPTPPPAPTVYRNRVLRVPATGAAYWADAAGVIHWIPDALSYDDYVATYGAPVSLDQAQVDALGTGRPWAPRHVRRVDAAGHILVVSATGTSYLVDASGQPHWIPTTSVFACLVASGDSVLRGIAQSQVNALGSGSPWATCTSQAPPPPPPSATPASITISWSSTHPSWIAMTLTGFAPGAYVYSCDFASGGDQSFNVSVAGSPQTDDNGATCYDTIAGDTVWVTIGSVTSNVITVPGSAPPPPPPTATYAETAGGVAHTWTDYVDAGGTEGPSVASGQTIQVACRATGFAVADGNAWWYKIASSPWSDAYWVSADAFYNDGATSGSLLGTPFVDTTVPLC